MSAKKAVQGRDKRTQNTCSRTVVFCSVLQNTEQNTKIIFGLEHRTEQNIGIRSGQKIA